MRTFIPDLAGRVVPTAGVALVALPYDRDSLIAALDSRAASPKPSADRLDSLYARLRVPFAAFAALSDTVSRLQDSAATLKTRLDSLPREAPQYRAGYSAFLDVTSARTGAERRQAEARRTLDRTRDLITPRVDSIRAALRAWEDSAYVDYEKSTAELLRRAVVPAVADTTQAPDGTASMSLPKGRATRWWIYARAWDAADPNAEWYWNVPVSGDTVELRPENARRRARY